MRHLLSGRVAESQCDGDSAFGAGSTGVLFGQRRGERRHERLFGRRAVVGHAQRKQLGRNHQRHRCPLNHALEFLALHITEPHRRVPEPTRPINMSMMIENASASRLCTC